MNAQSKKRRFLRRGRRHGSQPVLPFAGNGVSLLHGLPVNQNRRRLHTLGEGAADHYRTGLRAGCHCLAALQVEEEQR